MRFTVAIDGPAAAGKGTIARAVAARFGFRHLDTGLLYRAVGKRILDTDAFGNIDTAGPAVALNLKETDLLVDGLRDTAVTGAAARVAAVPGVRDALLDFQRRFASREGGAVLDGRDIATVVCPGADAKIYVTAPVKVRAERRHLELSRQGNPFTRAEVLKAIRDRDALDTSRGIAPLRRAPGAVLLDTGELSIESSVARAVAVVGRKLEQGRG